MNRTLYVALTVASSLVFGCDDRREADASSDGGSAGASVTTAGSPASGGSDGTGAERGLAESHADYFPIGAAVGSWHLDNLSDVLDRDFNHLTAENAMKMADIHPAEGSWNTAEADRIADFARDRGWKLTGHTLLWYRQTPAWMFEGITKGDSASLETLKGRLKAHIDTMIERYADVVDNWDVVNEAISDQSGKTYRDGAEGSTWYDLFGSEEYIYWAYKYAYDALEARQAGSAGGKLYYNEYTATVKVDKILTLLGSLEQQGIHVDGVGFQSHENLTWPSTPDLQTAIDRFVAAGYKVKISELDVTVYSDYSTGSFVPQPEVTFTPELEATQAERYRRLFELYRQNRDAITSVTFWGISDDRTWLDSEPVAGRNDHPLLYDDAHEPKAARASIMDF